MTSAVFPEAQPSYMRRKQGSSVTAYSYADGRPAGYVRRYDSPERAAAALAKARTRRLEPAVDGRDVVALDDGLALAFPNDLRVRDLRWVATRRKLKRTLAPLSPPGERLRAAHSAVRVVRYKPERRFVAELRLAFGDDSSVTRTEHCYLRFSADVGAARLARLSAEFAAAGVPVAKPLLVGHGDRLYVDRAVGDADLTADGVIDRVDPHAIADVVRRVHEAPVAADPVIAPAGAGSASFAMVAPELCAAAERCRAAIARRTVASHRDSACHGDLHFKQFVVGEGGLHLVDFERARRGDPRADLGQLLAHAHALDHRRGGRRFERAASAVVDAYRAASRGAADAMVDLGPAVAAALVDQALLTCRHFERGADGFAAELLDTAIAVLDHPSRRWWND